MSIEAMKQERNFCERCGKRLGGDGHIHTCTPPAAQPAYTREDLDRAFSAGLVEGEKLAFESPAAPVQEPKQMNGKQPPASWNTPAAQRQWVTLTDDVKQDMATDYFDADWAVRKALQLIDEHEAKLREKNGGQV